MKKLRDILCALVIPATFFLMELVLKIASVAVIALGGMVLGRFQPPFAEAINRANALADRYNNLSYCIVIALSIALFFLIFSKDRKAIRSGVKEHPLRLPYVLCLICFGLFCSLLVSALVSLLVPAAIENESPEGCTLSETILYVLGLVLAAPLAEELIFRGVMLRRLKSVFPTALAIALSSLAFGLFHGDVVSIVYSFLMGILFSLVYLKSKSLLSSIILHLSFNGMAVLLSLFRFSKAAMLASAAVGLIGACVLGWILFRSRRIDNEICT